MRTFAVILTSTFIILVSGCGDNSTSGPSGPVDYFPVALGNTWNYQSEGQLVSSGTDTTTIAGTSTRTVFGQTTHALGFSLWEIEQINNVTITTPDTTVVQVDTFYVYIAASDSQIVVYDDTVTTEYETILRLPVTVGETWQRYTDTPSITREVMSISENVTVQAGTYSNCLYVRDTDSESPLEFFNSYCAPDIGEARVTIEDQDPDHTSFVEVELTSFVVN